MVGFSGCCLESKKRAREAFAASRTRPFYPFGHFSTALQGFRQMVYKVSKPYFCLHILLGLHQDPSINLCNKFIQVDVARYQPSLIDLENI